MKVSGNPEVFKEANAKKKGGRVKCEGGKSPMRMDKPRRASGGRVGSDKNPFSSAHKAGSAGERTGGKPN